MVVMIFAKDKVMKKILFPLVLLIALIGTANQLKAQSSPYSGYYGETGPDNMSFQNNGKPIIFMFYNNDYCPSCPEAMDLVEQAFDNNFQGMYDFYIIDYADEENAGNYNFTENYNLMMPLTIVMQYIKNGQLTKYQKLPYLYNFTPYTYQAAFIEEVSTFFENEGDPFSAW